MSTESINKRRHIGNTFPIKAWKLQNLEKTDCQKDRQTDQPTDRHTDKQISDKKMDNDIAQVQIYIRWIDNGFAYTYL